MRLNNVQVFLIVVSLCLSGLLLYGNNRNANRLETQTYNITTAPPIVKHPDTAVDDADDPNQRNPAVNIDTNSDTTKHFRYVVNTDKAYLYNKAGELSTIKRPYLVKGDTIEAKADSIGFVYCEFTNSTTMKTSRGWITKTDLTNIQ